jgi:hypothetical protein
MMELKSPGTLSATEIAIADHPPLIKCFRPGCGATPAMRLNFVGYVVQCDQCKIRTPGSETKEDAAELWNGERFKYEEGFYLMHSPNATTRAVNVSLFVPGVREDSYLYVNGIGEYSSLVEKGYTFQPLYLAPPEPVVEPVPVEVIEIMQSFISSFPVRAEAAKNILDWLAKVTEGKSE